MEKKGVVDALEYRGGYALMEVTAIQAVITGYRDGKIKKDSIRVLAGKLEKAALHKDSKVDLNRILNCKATQDGVKRLRRGVVERVETTLGQLMPEAGEGRRKSLARRALRAMAQGRLSSSECIVLLMYFSRRISQAKPLRSLEPGERYARFTYSDLEELSGLSRSTISRAVASLKRKGWLSTVWVVQPNVNQYGLMFVDGPLLSLVPPAARKDRSAPPVREANKITTAAAQKSNAPVIEMTPLIKNNPKRVIKEKKLGSFKKDLREDFDRIRERARQITENLLEQVA